MRKTTVAAVLLAAACSKPAPPPAPASPLRDAVRAAAAAEACGRIIPSHWSPSLPVPAIEKGKPAYKIFFFGRDGVPATGFFFHHAEGDATLSSEGRVTACSRRPGEASRLPKFAPKPGVSLEELDSRERALYPELTGTAALYARGRALSADDKARVAAFAADFAFLVEAGQGSDYRALSPAFWSWVEAAGGAAPR